MIDPAIIVSIHPYFKVYPGKMDAFKAALPQFIKLAASEQNNLYYDFTINGDIVYCREAYAGAAGFLEHLNLVGPALGELLKLADVLRLEVHGAAAELDKLKGPLAGMNPTWFTFFDGVRD